MKKYNNNILLVDESLHAVANGYIGVRGDFEEGYLEGDESIKGTYLNGYFDTHHIKYPESAFGFPEKGETMVQVPQTQKIQIIIDNEIVSMNSEGYEVLDKKMDIRKGYSFRRIRWVSKDQHAFIITYKRMAHFEYLDLFMMDIKIECQTYEGLIVIKSYISHTLESKGDSNDPRVATEHVKPPFIVNQSVKEDLGLVECKTHNNAIGMQVVTGHDILGDWSIGEADLCFESVIQFKQTTEFRKYNVYTDERRNKDYQNVGINHVKSYLQLTSHDIYSSQEAYLNRFWSRCKIEIEGEKELTYALSYSQYQLLAAAGKDGVSQVAAKGLTGAGYEGHYFWDTEIYVVPFLTLTQPDLARKILKFRYSLLDDAKDRAIQLGHSCGAKIPWRTISGPECSSYFPAGTAQYHINADVAYAYLQYYFMTKDESMMRDFGYEVLYETALLWLELGHKRNNEFCIDGVTGPDEYTAIVNNNFYTNAMAKYHLYWTGKLFEMYKQDYMSSDKVKDMLWAADHMRLPYDETLNIHCQDDSFLSKAQWDFEHTPKDKYPLLLNFHPLVIYRHQVLKQADTVLAHFLLDEDDDYVLKDSYHYYEKITTHDSSLSPCVYGMMASRIHETEKAYDYFMESVYLDLHNTHGNTKDGLHIANAGGTYMSMVFGFGGLRIKPDGTYLNPVIPEQWKSYTFTFVKDDALVTVKVSDRILITTNKEVILIVNHKPYIITDEIEVALNEN